MTWTPETNRIPFGLLTDEEKAALQACKHGWVLYTKKGTWRACSSPSHGGVVYRAKPAPKRIVTWHNVYPDHNGTSHHSMENADRHALENRLCVYRIERNEDGSDPQIFVEDM